MEYVALLLPCSAGEHHLIACYLLQSKMGAFGSASMSVPSCQSHTAPHLMNIHALIKPL